MSRLDLLGFQFCEKSLFLHDGIAQRIAALPIGG